MGKYVRRFVSVTILQKRHCQSFLNFDKEKGELLTLKTQRFIAKSGTKWLIWHIECLPHLHSV
jgi:hypothetical protein